MEQKFQKSLSNLHSISSLVNDLDASKKTSLTALLRLIAESSVQLVENSSAVIYKTDLETGLLVLDSRVFVSNIKGSEEVAAKDLPRPDGLGYRSIKRRQRVISYEETDINIHPLHVENGVHSAICFPLIVKKVPQGILYLYLHESREFSDWEITQLEIFVNQAAMAFYQANEQKKLLKDLEKKESELRQLQTATRVLFSKQNLADTLNSILTLALEMTNAHYGIFRLMDRTKQNLVTYSYAGSDMQKPKIESLPINDKSVMGRVALSKKSILIDDLLDDAAEYYPLADDLNMRSELALPLINANGGLEGVINLESPRPKAFTVHNRLLVESLCTFAVIAINEFRLLESLIEITNAVQNLPLVELIQLILDRSSFMLNAEICDLWERSEDDDFDLVARAGSTIEPMNMPKVSDNIFANYSGLNTKRINYRKFSTGGDNEKDYVLAFSLLQSREVNQNDERILFFLESYINLAIEDQRRKEILASEQQQRFIAETFAAVGDVASNVLHTVNNRVGLIPVKIQSIISKRYDLLRDDPYLEKSLNDIGKFAVEALNTVSDNMQNLRPLEISNVNISDVLLEVTERFRDQEGIAFDLRLPPRPIFVRANHKNLIFICVNIVDNAVRAMRGKGKITLRATQNDNEILVVLEDNGPGMEKETLEGLFEFSTSHSDRSRLGFGLWWVKTMMTRLGGGISVDSVLDQGTAFTLRFPRSE